METKIKFDTSYHPKIDGKIEITNQVIEDMLRMYFMEKPTKWEYYLHLAEFSYSNGYEDSAKMSPFEIFYGKLCVTPVSWDSHVDHLIVGLEML